MVVFLATPWDSFSASSCEFRKIRAPGELMERPTFRSTLRSSPNRWELVVALKCNKTKTKQATTPRVAPVDTSDSNKNNDPSCFATCEGTTIMTTPATVQLNPLSHFSSAHKDERKEDPPISLAPPPLPSSARPTKSCLRSNAAHDPLLAARSRGLLKAMIDRFSSTPLDLSSSFSADDHHAYAAPSRSNHQQHHPNFRRNDTGVNDNDDEDDEDPSDNESNGYDESSAWLHNSVVVSPASSRQPTPPASSHTSCSRRSNSFATSAASGSSGLLTDAERTYLDELLHSGNADDMEAASRALNDPEVFFDEGTSGAAEGAAKPALTAKSAAAALDKMKLRTEPLATVGQDRRDSRLQQQLYHLHETTSVQPSLVISRMSLLLQKVQQQYKSQSIVQTSFSSADDDLNSIMSSELQSPPPHHKPVPQALSRDTNEHGDDWDPFEDVTAWLDGGGGEGGHGLSSEAAAAVLSSSSTVPFKILGTYGSDATCHPHVLSPPLMEALLNFCPEAALMGSGGAATIATANFWLKYSRVRDGGSLAQLLRQVRASTHTIVAVETSTGHVLGSFTSYPWRLASGWYGGSDSQRKSSDGSTETDDLEASSFVWKMRHPRCLVGSSSPVSGSATTNAPARRSIVEQVCQESEIQVFPIRSGSDDLECDATPSIFVQSCSLTHGLRLGQNELRHLSPKHKLSGTHLGHALAISPDLLSGSTSTSETFGNPCLTNEALRGEEFDIVNLEVWTLTPHSTIADAERRELSRLFLNPVR